MCVLELIKFLGHSSVYAEFNDFLTQHDVNNRPKIGRALDTIIPIHGQGLSMSFDINAGASGITPKSEGTFIFSQLEIRLFGDEKKNGLYSGLLPYELKANDSREAIEKKLGTPKRKMPEVDNYYIDGVVWTVAFDGDHLEFLQLGIPSNGKRKYGLCP